MSRIDAGWVAIAALFVFFDTILWVLFPLGADWAPLWTAGRLAWTNASSLYDFSLIAQLQLPLTGNADFHPYIYPPSALLLIAPISVLPFWASATLVAAVALAWLSAVSQEVGSDPLLVLLSPPVVLAAIVVQTSLLVIGMVILSCALLDRRARTAGTLLAIAALLKPTLLVLAPLGLVAGRHWIALSAATLTGVVGLAASVLLFGHRPWHDWLDALPRFQTLFAENEPLVRNAVSPFAFAVRYGCESLIISAIAAVIAASLIWIAFARQHCAGTRSALLMGGALLIAPYSMNYELAVFAPALLSLPRGNWCNFLVCAFWGASLFLNLGVAGLLVAYFFLAWPIITGSFVQSSDPANNRSM